MAGRIGASGCGAGARHRGRPRRLGPGDLAAAPRGRLDRLVPDPALANTATLGIGAAAGLLASLLAPRLGLVVGGLAAAAAGWALRFRPSPDTSARRRGPLGERRTARLLGRLEGHGWAILHDLAVPGSRANLDHLAIGPVGCS
jgi:hypothetical protein